jgi:SAM-dependent methyltransferase
MTVQSERYHDPARHWDGLHASERFRPIYPSEAVVRFLMGRFRARLQDGGRLSALDIGVGGGRHTRLLCELGFETFGIDVSAEGLKQTEAMLARQGLHATLRRAQMTALPFESDSFDAAISYGVFYYGTAEDLRTAIEELHRVPCPATRASPYCTPPQPAARSRSWPIFDRTYDRPNSTSTRTRCAAASVLGPVP